MEYLVGIASYKRAENQRTLAYLESIGVPKERILMAVQTSEDYDSYRAEGLESRVGKLLYSPAETAGENRNTILDAVKSGTRLVLMDDDIACVSRLAGSRLESLNTVQKFEHMVGDGFRTAAKYHTSVFGLYPIHNAFYMGKQTRSRQVVIGTLMGVVVTGMRFAQGMKTKEDYRFCCDTIRKYGNCVRLDYYACNAQHYTAGGCEECWADKRATAETARKLVGTYPDILTLNPNRPGEVKMIGGTYGHSRS
ncbi:MAG: hypothetical protein LUD72_00785 [Bacteroidales bacterium]|nr:hypothetical protein [Bacteroidales bacterium]